MGVSRLLVYLCVLLPLIFAKPLSLPSSVEEVNDEVAKLHFVRFLATYQKSYEKEEYVNRFLIFKENLKKSVKMNIAHGTPVFGVTKFSDLTPKEFRGMYLNYRPVARNVSSVRVVKPVGAPLDSVDWRDKGAVTAVKDQGQCGSCWAFSVTEEVESMWFLAGNSLTELSPQQIVSCDDNDGGCNGGDTINAYAYIQQAGLEADSSYPYTSGDSGDNGGCNYDSSAVVATISGYTYATPPCSDSCDNQDEDTLASNLASTGPASICVNAESWQSYTGGVLSSDCPHDFDDLDHCVQLVGYSDEGYWIVRNSWNTDWGVDGYIYIQQGSNLCGIADEATFVTI